MVKVHPQVLGAHRWSLLAGLTALDRSRAIRLRFASLSEVDIGSALLLDVTDNETRIVRRVVMDMADDPEIDRTREWSSDVVYKRSLRVADRTVMSQGPKVQPLGLTINCSGPGMVGSTSRELVGLTTIATRRRDRASRHAVTVSVRTSLGAASMKFGTFAGSWPQNFQRIESLAGQPITRPYVSYLVKSWDPGRLHSKRSQEEAVAKSERRAAIIRALRTEFGDRFVGGFVPSRHVAKHFPDCAATVATSQRDYLAAVAAGGIGVSTRGLVDSNPWKLAEYTAVGAAIVSEPLAYVVPTPLREGLDYSSFQSIEECVVQCRQLLDDAELLNDRRVRSAEYWRCEARPDRLLLNRFEELAEDGE